LKTVLVVSSDSANMQLMAQLIARRDDLKLLTANNGSDGLDWARACQPEVLVMDTGLSDISARDALARLRENPATSHIPVIAVSSDALKTQIDAGLQAGFYRYLTKPFKLSDLLDAIDNALGYTLERYDRFSSSPGSSATSVWAPVLNRSSASSRF
jgi:CheY-like chemotaxis protein